MPDTRDPDPRRLLAARATASGAQRPTAPEELRFRGGFRSGLWNNVTWPGARLVVSSDSLSISSVYASFRFTPEDVVDLVPHRVIPILGEGIRVIHTRTDCPEEIVFWPMRKPAQVIEAIGSTGFEGRASRTAPDRTGSPYRRDTRLFGPVVPIGLYLLQMWGFGWDVKHPELVNLLVPALIFLATVAAKPALARSPWAQSWATGPTRPLVQILRILALSQWTTGVVLLVLVAEVVFGL